MAAVTSLDRDSLARIGAHNRTVTAVRLGGDGPPGSSARVPFAAVNALATALRADEHVSSVQVRGVLLGDDGAAVLASALFRSPSVRRLWLEDCGLGPRAFLAISELLRKTKRIVDVSLRCGIASMDRSALMSAEQDVEDGRAVHTVDPALRARPGYARLVQHLMLRRKCVSAPAYTDRGGDAGDVSRLHTVDAAAGKHLAMSLRANQSLRSLDLRGVVLPGPVLVAVADALLVNRTLRRVGLSVEQNSALAVDVYPRLLASFTGNLALKAVHLDRYIFGPAGTGTVAASTAAGERTAGKDAAERLAKAHTVSSREQTRTSSSPPPPVQQAKHHSPPASGQPRSLETYRKAVGGGYAARKQRLKTTVPVGFQSNTAARAARRAERSLPDGSASPPAPAAAPAYAARLGRPRRTSPVKHVPLRSAARAARRNQRPGVSSSTLGNTSVVPECHVSLDVDAAPLDTSSVSADSSYLGKFLRRKQLAAAIADAAHLPEEEPSSEFDYYDDGADEPAAADGQPLSQTWDVSTSQADSRVSGAPRESDSDVEALADAFDLADEAVTMGSVSTMTASSITAGRSHLSESGSDLWSHSSPSRVWRSRLLEPDAIATPHSARTAPRPTVDPRNGSSLSSIRSPRSPAIDRAAAAERAAQMPRRLLANQAGAWSSPGLAHSLVSESPEDRASPTRRSTASPARHSTASPRAASPVRSSDALFPHPSPGTAMRNIVRDVDEEDAEIEMHRRRVAAMRAAGGTRQRPAAAEKQALDDRKRRLESLNEIVVAEPASTDKASSPAPAGATGSAVDRPPSLTPTAYEQAVHADGARMQRDEMEAAMEAARREERERAEAQEQQDRERLQAIQAQLEVERAAQEARLKAVVEAARAEADELDRKRREAERLAHEREEEALALRQAMSEAEKRAAEAELRAHAEAEAKRVAAAKADAEAQRAVAAAKERARAAADVSPGGHHAADDADDAARVAQAIERARTGDAAAGDEPLPTGDEPASASETIASTTAYESYATDDDEEDEDEDEDEDDDDDDDDEPLDLSGRSRSPGSGSAVHTTAALRIIDELRQMDEARLARQDELALQRKQQDELAAEAERERAREEEARSDAEQRALALLEAKEAQLEAMVERTLLAAVQAREEKQQSEPVVAAETSESAAASETSESYESEVTSSARDDERPRIDFLSDDDETSVTNDDGESIESFGDDDGLDNDDMFRTALEDQWATPLARASPVHDLHSPEPVAAADFRPPAIETPACADDGDDSDDNDENDVPSIHARLAAVVAGGRPPATQPSAGSEKTEEHPRLEMQTRSRPAPRRANKARYPLHGSSLTREQFRGVVDASRANGAQPESDAEVRFSTWDETDSDADAVVQDVVKFTWTDAEDTDAAAGEGHVSSDGEDESGTETGHASASRVRSDDSFTRQLYEEEARLASQSRTAKRQVASVEVEQADDETTLSMDDSAPALATATSRFGKPQVEVVRGQEGLAEGHGGAGEAESANGRTRVHRRPSFTMDSSDEETPVEIPLGRGSGQLHGSVMERMLGLSTADSPLAARAEALAAAEEDEDDERARWGDMRHGMFEMRVAVEDQVTYEVRRELMEAMKEGSVLVKHGAAGRPHPRAFRLRPDGLAIDYCPPRRAVVPDQMRNAKALSTSDIIQVVTGRRTANFARHSKADPAEVALSFSIICHDRTFDLVAKDRADFVQWVDGLRALLDCDLECPETVAEIQSRVAGRLAKASR